MTRPAVEARKATAEDLDDLLLLWTQAREELGRASRLPSQLPLDQFRARLVDALSGGDLILLIGRHEGVPAGYAVLRLTPVLLLDGKTLHVEQLFVLPSVRHRGVARALLVLATSIAERHGAEQVTAGAPPSDRDAHRFLARLGFSPLVVRRVVGTTALRRRLAGEGQRRGLEDLLSRRRSLRARALRAGWGRAGQPAVDDEPEDDEPTPRADGAPGASPALGPAPSDGLSAAGDASRPAAVADDPCPADGSRPGDGSGPQDGPHPEGVPHAAGRARPADGPRPALAPRQAPEARIRAGEAGLAPIDLTAFSAPAPAHPAPDGHGAPAVGASAAGGRRRGRQRA